MARNKRKKGVGGIYIIAAALLMVIALAIGLSAFFSVREINVSGNSQYTKDEVIAAAGVELGGSLFLASESKIAVNVTNQLPYIHHVQIEREYPATLLIVVEESVAVGYFQSGGAKWLVDQQGKILEQLTGELPENVVQIIGFTPVDPKVGTALKAAEGDTLRLSALQAVLPAMDTELLSRVRSLDVSSIGDTILEYEDRFYVHLGQAQHVKEKFDLLNNMVADLSPTDKGTIDLSDFTKGSFVPN